MSKKREDLTWGEFVKDYILPEFPDFRIARKEKSPLMIFWAWTMFVFTLGFAGGKKYLTKYLTTVGNTVYVPESWVNGTRKDHFNMIHVLVHEREHMRQSRRKGKIAHALAYIFWPFPIGFANYRLESELEAMAAATVYSDYVYDLFGDSYASAAKEMTSATYFWPTFSKTKAVRVFSKKLREKYKEEI